MNIQSAWQLSFDFLGSRPIVVEPIAEHLTSDAGLLPIRQFDEQIGLTAQFSAALHDVRFGPFVDHTFAEMTRSRIYGILAGYADQNDHDQLRYDPVFKLLAGRQPSGDELASQPTLSRFENAIDIASLWRLRDVLMDQFLSSFPQWAPPPHVRHRHVRRPDARPAAIDLLSWLLRAVSVPAAADHVCPKRSGGDGLPAARHGSCRAGGRR